MDRLPGLSLVINTGRTPYPGERARVQGVIMILLPQGVPQIKFEQNIRAKIKRPPTTPERIPGPKINSQNSAAELLSPKNSQRQKGIPETIKLGNKKNNQDINALPKIHSPNYLRCSN